MKKLFCSAAVTVLLLSVYLTSSLQAGAVTVGASTWYSTWTMTPEQHFKPRPALTYGPMASAKINDDFNITFLFLYGKFPCTEYGVTPSVASDLERYDSDLAINYKLSGYFKIFGGVKYMGYRYSFDSPTVNIVSNSYGVGPGVGISAVYPLYTNLYLLGNISFMYLKSSISTNQKAPGLDQTDTYDGKQYGINTSASLAYYFPTISTTLSLGGRYQVFKQKYNSGSDTTVPNGNTHFYGVTASASYTFTWGDN